MFTIRSITVGRMLAFGVAAACAGLVAQSPQWTAYTMIEAGPLPTSEARSRGLSISNLPALINGPEYSPDYARRTLLPAMSPSITAGDIDGDGDLDLYIVDPGGGNLLFRNTGKGEFRDITASTRVAGPGASLSASLSDYDRSGHPSLFVAGAGGIRLYQNSRNGTFLDVTRTAGLEGKPHELCTSAVLGDIDGDGFPDLLVTVYTDLDHPPSKPAFTFPNDFPGAVSRLYRNNGDGTFSDITRAAGLSENPGRARKGVLADFNNDQRLDILILRDDKPPVLYSNPGRGQFRDITWEAGDALTRHAFFDAVVSDLNRDGKLDIVLWSMQSFRVLLNRGNAIFEKAGAIPERAPIPELFGFHGTVADLDQNSFEDIVTVVNQGRLQAFVNRAGTFQESSLEVPPGFETAYFLPLQLKGLNGVHFLAIRPDRRIALLRLRQR
jgi:enediyne biosynthesis protein E4